MRRIITGLVAVSSVLAATACSGDDKPTEDANGLTTVTVGVLPIADVAPAYLGKAKGFFEDEGINLEIETVQGGPASIASIASGDLDFGYGAVTSLLLAHEAGLGMKLVAPGNTSTGVDGEDFGGIVAGEHSGVDDVADLAGKTVAVNTIGNLAEATLQVSLEDAAVDPDSVEYVEMPFGDMPGALANGNVDAAWTPEPFLSITQSQGARLLDSNLVAAGGDSKLLVGVYFTSASLAAEDEELVAAFRAAMLKSLAYADENPDEVRDVLLTYTELDKTLAQSVILPRFPNADLEADDVQHVADLSAAAGILPDDFDVSSLMD
jgi:NitT/TauT family transport system substrate-binding protein